MRKAFPILVCLLGLFFFLPFVSFSTAAPPDYVGVQVGEEYKWTLKINVNTYATFLADINATFPPEISTMLESMAEIQFKGVVSCISDEIFNASYSYVIVNLTLYMYAPGMGWYKFSDIGMPMSDSISVFMLSDETSNYFNNTMNAWGAVTLEPPINFTVPFIIVPLNLNWVDAIQGLNEIFQDIMGGMTGITVEVQGNGFKITIPEQLVNGSLMKKMDYVAQWNDKGVFSQGQVFYGGATLMSVNIAEGEIPGYEITILLGVLGVSTIGLIYYKKKKR